MFFFPLSCQYSVYTLVLMMLSDIPMLCTILFCVEQTLQRVRARHFYKDLILYTGLNASVLGWSPT